MPFDLLVFDFDGTLVASAAPKRAAYYRIFPDTIAHRAVVTEVLTRDPDGSRYAVIPRMRQAMLDRGLVVDEDDYVARYGETAEHAVRSAPELPGATRLLQALRGKSLVYLCSVTPIEPLREEVIARGWGAYFDGVYGYPSRKPETLAELLKAKAVAPVRAAVIGDGKLDEEAAEHNGCRFFKIASPGDLAALGPVLGVGDV